MVVSSWCYYYILGHDGKPCPSYLNSSLPEVFAHDMRLMKMILKMLLKVMEAANVIKELKRFTGLYALGSTIFSTPIDCQELTVVMSPVYIICGCGVYVIAQMPSNIKKVHLLQVRLFPVRYKTSSLLSHSGYSMMHRCPTLNAIICISILPKAPSCNFSDVSQCH